MKTIDWKAYQEWFFNKLKDRLTENLSAVEFGEETIMDGESYTEVSCDGLVAQIPTRFIKNLEVNGD